MPRRLILTTWPTPGSELNLTSLPGSDIAALLKTPLGDVLVAGLLKDPEDAGRLIAQGIMQTEARISAAHTPDTTPEPKPEAKAKTPPAPAPKAAE